jgi:hypothetical protein
VVDRHVRATACALAAVHPPRPVEVLVAEGHKGTAAPAEEVAEALCGVLVDVFALADHYHVDLDELYPHLLTRLVSDHPGGAGGAGNDPGAGWKEGPR